MVRWKRRPNAARLLAGIGSEQGPAKSRSRVYDYRGLEGKPGLCLCECGAAAPTAFHASPM